MVLVAACDRSSPAGDSANAPAVAPATPPAPEPLKVEPKHLKGNIEPVGPELVILPGQGAGAIRFGTNLEKLAQHMGSPCDIVTDDRCVYVDQAAEFALEDGVVKGMKFHRRDRKVAGAPGAEKYYGSFNGGMRPGIMFGLHEHVVEEEFGKPERKEPLSGPDGQVERAFYPGVILEYDKLENGNVVLSGIEVVKK